MNKRINKQVTKGGKDTVFHAQVVSIIDQIRDFLDENSIVYDEEAGVLEIMQAGLCYRIEYFPGELSLSFGLMAQRTYRKKKKRKIFLRDFLYLLEKFLMNEVKLVDYIKNEMLLGDILWVKDEGGWNPELYDEKLLARLKKKKKLDTDTYKSNFVLKKGKVKSFIKELNKNLAKE